MQDLTITQHTQPLAAPQVDKLEHWAIALRAEASAADWRALPYGELLRRRRRLRLAAVPQQPLVTDLPNARGTRVVLHEFPAAATPFEQLTRARRMADELVKAQADDIAISCHAGDPASMAAWAEAVVSALLAQAVELPSYKTDGAQGASLRRLRIFGAARPDAYARARAEAAGNALARALAVLPSNELTPAQFRARAEALAREHGWECEFLDQPTLARRGAGAFLAVAQGSPIADAGILRLGYRPETPPRRRGGRRRGVALVGKGICFDTGGVNLKSARHMFGMHEDMQGSAVALGTLLALSRLEVDFAIDCWLALATNHIGPQAYKPNDVVRALDGTTIEIVHTDAEGRMVLADTLTLASNKRPALILDYATLTGACIQALGKAYSGAFTNRSDLHPILIEAGRASGERVWPFPQDEDYDRALDSPLADIRQCAQEGAADHILAARFLGRFVKHDVPWVHLDLGAATHKGGLAHVPTDTTGFGVRYSVNLLLEQRVLERL